MSEWKEIKLGQCVNMISGGTPSKDNDDYWNGVIPWASAKDLKSFLLHDTQDHITKIGSQNGTRITPKGSILILVRGMTLHNDFPICRVTQDMTFNQDIKAIIPDQSIIDTGYLAYWLLASKYQLMSLVESASHGTGRINTNVLKSIKVLYPSLHKQKAIARILENFDTKIDNLRRQNGTLEAIAQTLFKHWFIDFEFPDADGKPYKSSGGGMWRSAIGDIPEDWRVGKLGEMIVNYDKKRIPLASNERQERQGKYPYYGAASIMDYIDDYIFDGLYILMGEDGTVIDENGHPILQYVFGKFWANNHAHVLQGGVTRI